MNRTKTLFFSTLTLCSIALFGCGYVVLPIAQCTQSSDCDAPKHCLRGSCVTSGQHSGTAQSGQPCQQSSDCLASLQCQQQTCQTPSTSGKEQNTTGNTENTGHSESTAGHEFPPTESPQMDGGTTDDSGHTKDDATITPDDDYQVPSPTIQSVAAGNCLPGTSRHCLYKSWNTDPQPCGHGQQTCQFDQTWDSCQGRTMPAPWFPPSRKETCDDIDNNCDGYVDEGCLQATTGCSMDYAHRYSPPTHHIAFSKTNPEAYSEQRHVILHTRSDRKQLQLSKITYPNQHLQQAQVQWLMEFPSVDLYPYSYDLNKQGDLVAMSNGKKVVLWHLHYAQDGTPSIRSYASIAIENVYLLAWSGDGKDLILYQYEYNSSTRKPLVRFLLWRADVTANSELTLQLKTKVVPQPLGHETSNEFQKSRLSIHPNGRWLVLAHYSSLAIYRLPDFHLLKVVQLGSPADPEFRTLAFHPKGHRLVLAPFQYHKILTIDLNTNAQGIPSGAEQNIYGTQGMDVSGIEKIGFHPTTGELYAQTRNGLFHWKDTTTPSIQNPEFLAGFGSTFAMHNKSDWVAVGNSQGWISLIHTQSGQRLASWLASTNDSYPGYIQTMSFSPDGSALLVSTPYGIQFWNVTTDGKGGYSIQAGQTLNKFTPGASKPLHVHTQFSQDGTLLAVVQNQDIAVWTRSTQNGSWQKSHDLTGHTANIKMVSIHPSKRWLVSGGDDKQLRLWSLETQPTSRVLKTYPEAILGVSFYTNPQQEDFVLVSLAQGDTFVWSLEATTTPVSTELSGSLSNNNLVNPVYFYNAASSYFFTVSKTSSGEENQVMLRDIYISPKQTGQPRTVSLNGVNRLMPKPGFTLSVQYDKTRRSLFGFTSDEIRVWVCPNR